MSKLYYKGDLDCKFGFSMFSKFIEFNCDEALQAANSGEDIFLALIYW